MIVLKHSLIRGIAIKTEDLGRVTVAPGKTVGQVVEALRLGQFTVEEVPDEPASVDGEVNASVEGEKAPDVPEAMQAKKGQGRKKKEAEA